MGALPDHGLLDHAVLRAIERFFRQIVPTGAGDLVLLAFSGGPDSTALALALRHLAPELGLRLHAAHFDHRSDPDSERRAEAARSLAEVLALPFTSGRAEEAPPDLHESREAAARRLRYAFLEQWAEDLGARYVATAHHLEDQAETVLLRLLFGSGLEGLAGIRPQHGRVIRPLLTVRKAELQHFLHQHLGQPLTPTADPTNFDLRLVRNLVRHHLLPRLEQQENRPLVEPLARLATAARRAQPRLAEQLAEALDLDGSPDAVSVDRHRLAALPAPLVPHALALLHRRAGAPYPAGGDARRELLRQLESRHRIGCDGGGGWRWEGDLRRLRLLRRRDAARQNAVKDFTYTLEVPGEIEIPELGWRFRLVRSQLASWMFQGQPRRAGLAHEALEPGNQVVIRNRRSGDRLQPLGSDPSRRLKDLLIARRIARQERARLPLLVIDGTIAWVPGVAVDERFRLHAGAPWAWSAELVALDESESLAREDGSQ